MLKIVNLYAVQGLDFRQIFIAEFVYVSGNSGDATRPNAKDPLEFSGVFPTYSFRDFVDRPHPGDGFGML
jgi:hypothetical protein